jgi:hypothetical protein
MDLTELIMLKEWNRTHSRTVNGLLTERNINNRTPRVTLEASTYLIGARTGSKHPNLDAATDDDDGDCDDDLTLLE